MTWQDVQNAVSFDLSICCDRPPVPASTGRTKTARNARIFPPRDAEIDGRNIRRPASMAETAINPKRIVVEFIPFLS